MTFWLWEHCVIHTLCFWTAQRGYFRKTFCAGDISREECSTRAANAHWVTLKPWTDTDRSQQRHWSADYFHFSELTAWPASRTVTSDISVKLHFATVDGEVNGLVDGAPQQEPENSQFNSRDSQRFPLTTSQNSHKARRSSNSDKYELNLKETCGWILLFSFYRINNRARWGSAMYNSYQNALIPQREKPIPAPTEQLQVSSFDDSVQSLLGGLLWLWATFCHVRFSLRSQGSNGARHIFTCCCILCTSPSFCY